MSGCYLIVSHLNKLALDVEASKTAPGTKVIPWKKHGKDNQLWYDDPLTGTIRSKLTHMCLDVEGDQLVVKPYQPGDLNQQWERHEHQIRNRVKQTKVLDIFSKNKSPGAQIGVYEFNGGHNQLWDFEFVGGIAGVHPTSNQPRRDFYIMSEMNGKVVDIQAANAEPDTKILMWLKDDHPKRNQLWYLDQQGFIRSALNDMVFQNKEAGDKLKTKPFSADPRGHWGIDGKKIVNGVGECLDIKQGEQADGAKLLSYRYSGGPNQHWRIEYV